MCISAKLLSICLASSLTQSMDLFIPKCQIWHLPLNFMSFLSAHFSRFSEWYQTRLVYPVYHSFQFCLVCILAQEALCPIIQVVNEDVKEYQPQCQALWLFASDWRSGGLCPADHSLVGLAFEQVSIHLIIHFPSLDCISLPGRLLWETVLKVSL